MRRSLALLLCVFCCLGGIRAQKSLVILCGHLLDVRSGKMLSAQAIRIERGRITNIGGANANGYANDSVIDLSAWYVLPGLIDCHTHVLLQADITAADYDVQVLKESIPYRTILAVNSCRTALMNGFTSIRDLGTEGAKYADVDLKKAIMRNEMTGPRMFVSTLAINTTGHYALSESEYAWELPIPKGIQEITGADEGRRAVREQIAHGADWIKIYADRGYYQQADGSYRSLPNFSTEEIMAIGDEAARSHRKMAAHAVTRDGILAAIQAGVSSIEHGFGMDDECIQQMVKKNVYWCPTIFINDYVADGRAQAGSPINKAFAETEPALVAKAIKAGVKVAYGTDIGGYDWKQSETKDFEYLVRYGMTPIHAIQTATINAADLLSQQNNIGELKTGAFADLIALKDDPTKDIHALNSVSWVIKGGVVFKKP